MNYSSLVSLKTRKFLFQAYNFMAPWISKTGVTKIRLKENTLGQYFRLLFFRILHLHIPDPVETNGMVLYHSCPDKRGWLGWLYAFDNEPHMRGMLKRVIKPGMTVVDVGAHIGYYTLLSARLVGDTGEVYAFEPDPSYYGLLKKNIEVNKLVSIVWPFNFAVGNNDGKIPFFLGISTGSSLFRVPDITGQKVLADMVSLDNFFARRNWPVVDFVKIDAEGADKIALEGMRGLIERNPALKLVIEAHPLNLKSAGTSLEELFSLLSELGFRQVDVLFGKMESYRIPQDTAGLLEIVKSRGYTDLFCQR